MPALLPPPMPTFACSMTRASGNRERTSSSEPSVEPWSTTIVSQPRTLVRQRSSCSTPFRQTTIAETSERLAVLRSGRLAPLRLYRA